MENLNLTPYNFVTVATIHVRGHGPSWQIQNKKTKEEMKIGEGGMGLCLALRFTFLGWMLPTV